MKSRSLATKRAVILIAAWRRMRKRSIAVSARATKKPHVWVNVLNTADARKAHGDYLNLLQEMRTKDPEKFRNHLRVTPAMFDQLVRSLTPVIQKDSPREPLTPEIRLAITLRYLASGDSMISVARQFRVGESTVSLIIRETCEAIWDVLHGEVLLHDFSAEKWKDISCDFSDIWNFPNCIGAIDGKHIVFQAPPNSGSLFYNYKGSFSTVLLAACDANYKFTLVDIGAPGRRSDGGIFKESAIGKGFMEQKFQLPLDAKISDNRPEMPFVLVGDEAFPLTDYLMRPFPGRNLDLRSRIYNYRLSRARRTIENAFGILAARFRIFRKPILCSLETGDAIIKATVCLHNFIMQQENEGPVDQRRYVTRNMVDRELPNGTVIEGNWRQYTSSAMCDIRRAGTNTHNRHAADIRNCFKDFFSEEGAVSFQEERIHLHEW